jgi:hypothetical protein
MSETSIVGLAVTSEFLEWEVRGESRDIVNTPECFHRFTASFPDARTHQHVVCENAGGAERRIVAWLLTQRVRVSIADPEAVCAHAGLADAEGIRPDVLAGFARACPDALRPATIRDYPPRLLGPIRPPHRPSWRSRLAAAFRHWLAQRTRPPALPSRDATVLRPIP